MSSNESFGGRPDYLEAGPAEPTGPRRTVTRRTAAVAVGALAAVAVVAGGVWAYSAWFDRGPQPSEVLPSDTLAYVSIDLDPTGQQKVEALEFLGRFPAFEEEIGLDTDDDIRREIFESIQDAGTCPDLDYAQDIEPWLGQRAALAVVDQGEEVPTPVFVLAITDQHRATEGLEAVQRCAAGPEDDATGFAFQGDWVVLAPSEEAARGVVEDAQDGALADDVDFVRWTEAAGDPGVVTMYAAPEAGQALLDVVGGQMMDLPGISPRGDLGPGGEQPAFVDDMTAEIEQDIAELPEGDPGREFLEQQLEMIEQGMVEPIPGADEPDGGEVPPEVEDALADFAGAAGTVRFDDGALEIEFAGAAADEGAGALLAGDGAADVVSTLPASTAVALGLALGDGWAQTLLDELAPVIEAASGMSVDEAVAEVEAMTGLRLPEDVETLAGESFALALDSSVDGQALESEDPAEVPVGLKVKGDVDEIEAVLDRLRETLGEAGDELLSRSEGDHVVIGADADYLEELLQDGELGEDDALADVVPEAGDSAMVLFVDFDADDWLDSLMQDLAGDEPEVRDNVEPLSALGISSWVDGEESHALISLTTED